jgi:hypothetical protein
MSSVSFSLETMIQKGNLTSVPRKSADMVTREPRVLFTPEYVADRTTIDLTDRITVNIPIFGTNPTLTLLDENNLERTRRLH